MKKHTICGGGSLMVGIKELGEDSFLTLAKNIILEGKGKHFDPDIVDAFIKRETRFIEIMEKFRDK